MNSKIIIYDDNCPLCSAYTNVFVKCGLVDKDGRKDFSSISPGLLEKIDVKRSVNEIPVIDLATNHVSYGIDALLEILQQKIPFAKRVGNIAMLRWILERSYKFISYNRRVIVAAKRKSGNFDCTPDFNYRYRFVFLCFFLVFNTLVLFPLQQYVLSKSLFDSDIGQLQFAHIALVLINVVIAFQLDARDGFEYLGQVNMLALSAILLCVPLILFNRYSNLHNASFNSFYLGMVTFFSVHEYSRRFIYIDFYRRKKKIVLINIASVTAFVIYLAM